MFNRRYIHMPTQDKPSHDCSSNSAKTEQALKDLKRKVANINQAHICHADILPIIERFETINGVISKLVGHSFEQRSIHLLTLGHGDTVIFAWTQMHGNEATATAAVFDWILALLSNQYEEVSGWEEQFTIHILPMLNPDGAERCIRQNAQAIDINRDARALQSPEGRLLMRLVDELSPDIGLNLHDQSPYYQCGTSKNPATIAFLAPAFDYAKTIDESRRLAMQIIAYMNTHLQTLIPGCVARYDDTYGARCFGDNIASKQVSTILIESGAAVDDPDRLVARKMNLESLQKVLQFLMNKDSLALHQEVEDYFLIPENKAEALSSLVIRGLNFFTKHNSYSAGISIKQSARYSDYFFIDYIGDLGIQAGLKELDAHTMCFQQGRTYQVTEAFDLTDEKYLSLLSEGYIAFFDPNGLMSILSSMPVCIDAESLCKQGLRLMQPAYFLIAKNDEVYAAILNGQLVYL